MSDASKLETTETDAPVTRAVDELPSKPTSPLQELAAACSTYMSSSSHSEIWGVTLQPTEVTTHTPTQIVLQKYLNANDGDLSKAKSQLQATLKWRAKTKPLELLKRKFNKEKFAGLGYVTVFESEKNSPDGKEVFTWNIYGGVKSVDETFGDVEEFINWRVALQELALVSLNLPTATVPITEVDDPYKIIQVHDYKSISFLRQSPSVKAASTETIRVFAQNYPELLKEKFFLNVPAIMGFVYAFIKPFVAEKTRKKFHPMSNGKALVNEFGSSTVVGLGKMLPKEYGGTGEDLDVVGHGVELE